MQPSPFWKTCNTYEVNMNERCPFFVTFVTSIRHYIFIAIDNKAINKFTFAHFRKLIGYNTVV